MIKVTAGAITGAVAQLCQDANFNLRDDVLVALRRASRQKTTPRARRLLQELVENARIAGDRRVPVCQDTGLPVVFLEIGRDVSLSGVDVSGAVQKGVDLGYRQGYLRNSIVSDPLRRGKGSDFSPGVLHVEFVSKRGLTISVLPKGFGCENKTQLKMFNPTASMKEIADFIVEVVGLAGCDACPPYVIGVGIGGTADHAALLSKKALLRPIDRRSHLSVVARMEKDLVKRLNSLSIGPLGLGGEPTALGVNILTAPTHIAGLPVCVNISCHALRSATIRLPRGGYR